MYDLLRFHNSQQSEIDESQGDVSTLESKTQNISAIANNTTITGELTTTSYLNARSECRFYDGTTLRGRFSYNPFYHHYTLDHAVANLANSTINLGRFEIRRSHETGGASDTMILIRNMYTFPEQADIFQPMIRMETNVHNGATPGNPVHWCIGTSRLNSDLFFDFNNNAFRCWITPVTSGQLNRTIEHLTISDENLNVGDVVEMTGSIIKNEIQINSEPELDEEGNPKFDPETNEPLIITTRKLSFVVNPTEFKASDCCPMIKKCSSITSKFCGVITEVIEGDDMVTIESGFTSEVRCDRKCYRFATHGDFLLKVPSTSALSVGQILLSNLQVLNGDTPLTTSLQSAIVGKISHIVDSTTVTIFKE